MLCAFIRERCAVQFGEQFFFHMDSKAPAPKGRKRKAAAEPAAVGAEPAMAAAPVPAPAAPASVVETIELISDLSDAEPYSSAAAPKKKAAAKPRKPAAKAAAQKEAAEKEASEPAPAPARASKRAKAAEPAAKAASSASDAKKEVEEGEGEVPVAAPPAVKRQRRGADGAKAAATSSSSTADDEALALAIAKEQAEEEEEEVAPPIRFGRVGNHQELEAGASYGRSPAWPAVRVSISMTSAPAASPDISAPANAELARYAADPAAVAQELELTLTRTLDDDGVTHLYCYELRKRGTAGPTGVVARSLVCLDIRRNEIQPATARYNLNLLNDPKDFTSPGVEDCILPGKKGRSRQRAVGVPAEVTAQVKALVTKIREATEKAQREEARVLLDGYVARHPRAVRKPSTYSSFFGADSSSESEADSVDDGYGGDPTQARSDFDAQLVVLTKSEEPLRALFDRVRALPFSLTGVESYLATFTRMAIVFEEYGLYSKRMKTSHMAAAAKELVEQRKKKTAEEGGEGEGSGAVEAAAAAATSSSAGAGAGSPTVSQAAQQRQIDEDCKMLASLLDRLEATRRYPHDFMNGYYLSQVRGGDAGSANYTINLLSATKCQPILQLPSPLFLLSSCHYCRR